MFARVTHLHEAAAAHAALERLLARVRPYVQGEIVPFATLLVAVRTLIVARVRVHDHVRVVRTFRLERFVAQHARERPLIVVHRFDVHVQLRLLREPLEAYVALEALVVLRLVHAELLLGVARELAPRAMHRLLGRVRQQVVHGRSLILVHVAAHVAGETHLFRVDRLRGMHPGVFLLQVLLERVHVRETDAAQVALEHLVLGMPLLEMSQQVVPRLEHGRAQLANGLLVIPGAQVHVAKVQADHLSLVFFIVADNAGGVVVIVVVVVLVVVLRFKNHDGVLGGVAVAFATIVVFVVTDFDFRERIVVFVQVLLFQRHDTAAVVD